MLWQERSLLNESMSLIEAEWLFNEDSLTKRLIKLSHQAFAVSPLREEWQVLRQDEYQKLATTRNLKGWVREVILVGNDEPWVFARSVALQTDLNHSKFNLTNIGNKSLGSILFQDKTFQRAPIEITRYPAMLLPVDMQYANLWGRRSSFINKQLNILVQEVFLPQFWQRLANEG